MQNTNDLIKNLVKQGAGKPFPKPSVITLRWIIAILVYFVFILWVQGIRDDLFIKLNNPVFLFEIIAMFLIMLSAAYSASLLSLPDLNQRPLFAYLPLVPLSFFVLVLIYGIFSTNSLGMIQCLLMGRYDCMFYIVTYSIVPAILFFITISRGAPVRCCFAGSMAGLSAASLGYLVLRFVDSSDDPMQLLIWHFIPVILLMLVGMLLGKMYLAGKSLLSR